MTLTTEGKKLLWISISAVVAVLIIVGIGFFLFSPKKNGLTAPASINNAIPAKSQNSQDYLLNTNSYQGIENTDDPNISDTTNSSIDPNAAQIKTDKDGKLIVTYGNDPTTKQVNEQELRDNNTKTVASADTSGTASSTRTSKLDSTKNLSNSKNTSQNKTSSKSNTTSSSKVTWSKPKIKTAGKYWIQVIAVKNKDSADSLVSKLNYDGLAAKIDVYKKDTNTILYRVLVGSYQSYAEANSWLVKVRDVDGCKDAVIRTL